MKTHKWCLNGETVKFSVSGRLIDGQSRLMAIVEAGVAITLEVRAGLPDVAQESMDCGELRKGSHTLEMMGENNPGILAPALRIIWMFEKGLIPHAPRDVGRVMENSEIKPALERHAGLKESVGWVVGPGHKIKNFMAYSTAAAFHYLCGREGRDIRDHFFEALSDGIGLTKTAPVYHLREKLLARRQQSAGAGRNIEIYALIIKAWNATVAGEKASDLRFVSTGPTAEKFPILAGSK